MSSDGFYKSLRTKGSRRFLYRLYLVGDTSNNKAQRSKRSHIIGEAKNWQLQLLLRLLRRIATSKIHVHPSHFEALKKSRVIPHLNRYFQSDDGFRKLRTASRESKIKVLNKVTQYHTILSNLFR
jgi:mannose-6-phosphate isomerase class I